MDRRERIRRYGLLPTLWRRLMQLQRPVFAYVRLHCLLLSAERCRLARAPARPGIVVRETPLEDLEALTDTLDDLRPKDLALARQEGHRCIGVYEAGRLASFSFNVAGRTRYSDALRLVFPDGWVYHWMAVTLPQWRGQRLHALQIPEICKLFAGPGFRGLVALVDSVNYPSLRSFGRIGFEEHGTFTIFGVGAQARVVAGPTQKFRLARTVL